MTYASIRSRNRGIGAITIQMLFGLLLCLVLLIAGQTPLHAQGLKTTTVQGIAYRADGTAAQGTVVVTWPNFTTASNQQITAGSVSLTLGPTGYLSVNLAPNVGSYPAGTYYTAVYHLSDSTVQTQYWLVPAAAQASLASVQAQVVPATQAVQTISKAYVDAAVANASTGMIPTTGGTLTGPLTLYGDPTSSLQAATKHYVDSTASTLLPLSGGTMTGPITLSGDPTSSTQATTKNYVDKRTPVSVLNYGAKCDGLTDDSAALQAALDAAYASNGVLELQIPASTCYTAKTLHYRGESMVGLGPISDSFGNKMSRILGPAGADVLANGDPACAPTANHNYNCTDANGFAWQPFLQGTVLRDLTIGVNITVDASSAPASGTQPAGNGSYSRPIAENSIFSPNACVSNGCWTPKNGKTGDAASGWSTHFVYAPNTTPQKGSGAGWWVGNCGIALPNSHPTTTANFPYGFQGAVLTNITFTAEGTASDQNTQARPNHTCAMYEQAPPYDAHFEHVYTNYLASGFMIPLPGNGAFPNSSSDANSYTDIVTHAAHVFYTEMGSYNRFVGIQSYVTQAADTDEAPTGIIFNCSGLCVGANFQNVYQEPGFYSTSPVYTMSLNGAGGITGISVTTPGYNIATGATVTVSDSQGGTGSGATVTPVMDAWGTITGFTVTGAGSGYSHPVLNIPGNTMNPLYPGNYFSGLYLRFDSGNVWQGGGGLTVMDGVYSSSNGFGFGVGSSATIPGTTTGYNTMLVGSGTGSVYDGYGDSYNGTNNVMNGIFGAAVNAASLGYSNTITSGQVAQLPYQNPVNRISADALSKGLSSATQLYSSNDDLLITPEAMVSLGFANGSVGNAVINDSTAPLTGRYAYVPNTLASGAASPWQTMGGFWSTSIDGSTSPYNRLGWLGETGNFPQQAGTVYVALKASAAVTAYCQVSNGGAYAPMGSGALAVTTSWQVFSFPYTMTNANFYTTGSSPAPLGVQFHCSYMPANMQVAFYAFVPNTSNNDVTTKTLEAANSITTPALDLQSESGGTLSLMGQISSGNPKQLQITNSPSANSFTIRGYQQNVGENQTLELNPGGAAVHINGKLACLADGTNCLSGGSSVASGTSGQVAVFSSSNTISGTNQLAISAGGTNATTAAAALANLGVTTINAMQNCQTAGVYDDTCIRRSLGSGNVQILIPNQTYTINSQITVSQSNVTLSCQPGATLKRTTNLPILAITGLNVTVQGCTFDGGGLGALHGVLQVDNGATNPVLDGDVITNSPGDEAVIGAGFTGGLFNNLQISGSPFQIYAPASGFTIRGGTMPGLAIQSAGTGGLISDFVVDGTTFLVTGSGSTGASTNANAITLQNATTTVNVTGFSIDSANNVTFTANNSYAVGQLIALKGMVAGSYLNLPNAGLLTVTSSTGTQFTASSPSFVHAAVAQTADSGVASNGPILNGKIVNTTCKISGTSSKAYAFGCWSIPSGDTMGLVFANNTASADNQFISYALAEIGCTKCEILNNIISAVDTNGLSYSNIVNYGGNAVLQGNYLNGWGSGGGAGILFIPNVGGATNADHTSIIGNHLNNPSGCVGGQCIGIAVECNYAGGSAQNTEISGNTINGTQTYGIEARDNNGACPVSVKIDENTITGAATGFHFSGTSASSFAVGKNSGVTTTQSNGSSTFVPISFNNQVNMPSASVSGNVAAASFSGSGSGLTNLNPANVTAGALPSGVTATTRTAGDNSASVATDAFVAAAVASVTPAGIGALAAANNLSDVANAGTALANLGGVSSTYLASNYCALSGSCNWSGYPTFSGSYTTGWGTINALFSNAQTASGVGICNTASGGHCFAVMTGNSSSYAAGALRIADFTSGNNIVDFAQSGIQFYDPITGNPSFSGYPTFSGSFGTGYGSVNAAFTNSTAWSGLLIGNSGAGGEQFSMFTGNTTSGGGGVLYLNSNTHTNHLLGCTYLNCAFFTSYQQGSVAVNGGFSVTGTASLLSTGGSTPIYGNGLMTESDVASYAVSNLPLNSATNQSWSGRNYHAYGDSITGCQGATNLASQCYTNLTGTALGATTTNNGATGSEACDNVNLVFNSEAPVGNGSDPLFSFEDRNGATYQGVGSYEQVAGSCLMAAVTWMGTHSAQRIPGVNLLWSGSWTADTTYSKVTGLTSTTNGSTASTSITTYGNAIYAWYRIIDGNGGTFSYQLDGGTAVSVNAFTSPAIATHNGSTSAVGLLRIPNVAAGTHALMFTVTSPTSSSNVVSLLAVGTPSANHYQYGPTVIVEGVVPGNTDASQQATAQYNADDVGYVQTLQGDGLDVRFANLRLALQGGLYSLYTDSIHPNPTGYAAMVAPLLAAAQHQPASSANGWTLSHSQLPALASADIPNNSANTTGTAGNLSGPAFAALTDGSTVTLATSGNILTSAKLTLNHATSSRTLNVTGLVSGAMFTVVLPQDSTGGASLALGSGCTWYLGTNSGYAASTSPSLNTAANGISVLSAIYDGSNCYANVR